MNFIVIGSGIAGLNFALKASKLGKVLIITKKEAVDAGTNYAQGGIAGVLGNYDSFEKHIEDTLKAGSYHNNKKAVRFMVKKAPKAIMDLIEYGVNFASHNGEILLTREGGHCERRIAFVGDYTGKEIEEILLKNVKTNKNIKILEHSLATELIIEKNQCLGVKFINNKQIKEVFAEITVIATGGCGQVYEHTTNPEISTGDGLAIAYHTNLKYKTKIKFKDLEFIQFHPTAFNFLGEAKFLISEAVRGEGAYLKNKEAKRFMLKIHKLAELAPRDIVAQSIYKESKKGQVYLDIRHKNKMETKIRFPQIYKYLKNYGFDLTKDLIPISPAAHYCCGGIKVNLKGETGVKNLYAFGEVTCTGVHGANRLASNSLVEALVFSSEILNNINLSNFKKDTKFSIKNTEEKYCKLNKKTAQALNLIQKELKATMWNYTGIVRTQAELKQAKEKISHLLTALDTIKTEINAVNEKLTETENLLITAKLITEAAFKRKKSLGGHLRVLVKNKIPKLC